PGSLVGNVTDNGVLAFNRSDHLDFVGTVSGTGGLTKDGAGVLTVSGTNSYLGLTTVRAGAMVVNGTLGKTTVSVDDGALLGGIGTIAGSVNVATGGMLAPGVPPGTLPAGALNTPNNCTYALMTCGRTLALGRNGTAD